MKAQGSELYAIDPSNNQLLTVGCILDISGLDSAIEQIEITCLSDTVRKYDSGLATPGQAQFGIYANPKDASHIRLQAIKKLGTTIKWALGWSDKTGTPPTVLAGDFSLVQSRSWLTWQAFMRTFPFDFAQNAHVRSNVQLQLASDPVWVPRTTT